MFDSEKKNKKCSKKNKKHGVSRRAGRAATPGSSGRSEAALTAGNGSLSAARCRPAAGKIYKRRGKKSVGVCCQNSAASGQRRRKEVFVRRRRRFKRTPTMFRFSLGARVVLSGRSQVSAGCAWSDGCRNGGLAYLVLQQAAAIFSPVTSPVFIVWLLSSRVHTPSAACVDALRVMFWPPVFALGRRDISGEQKSRFQPLSFHVGQCRLSVFFFFFNSFPFFGARLKINSRTGTTQGAIPQH